MPLLENLGAVNLHVPMPIHHEFESPVQRKGREEPSVYVSCCHVLAQE
jgi:hypothetical protein